MPPSRGFLEKMQAAIMTAATGFSEIVLMQYFYRPDLNVRSATAVIRTSPTTSVTPNISRGSPPILFGWYIAATHNAAEKEITAPVEKYLLNFDFDRRATTNAETITTKINKACMV
jgi:hypothetical protein